MEALSIFHNPRCSKSRKTLEIIEINDVEVQVILYLQDPPSVSELNSLLEKLGMKASELVRKGSQSSKNSILIYPVFLMMI